MKKVVIIIFCFFIISFVELSAQLGHWSVVEKIDTSIIYKKISCIDSLNCLSCATWGFTHKEFNVFRKTFDGGNSWIPIFVDKGNAVRDEDSNWLYWKYPPAINDMDCPTNNLCVSVHDSGYISRTTDGGYFWDRLIVSPSRLTKIDMFDSLNGIAIGYFADGFLTNDGGITWSKISFPDSISSLRFWLTCYPDTNTIIITAFGPDDIGDHVLKSTDNGKNWSKGEIVPGSVFMDIKFLNSSIGWGVGPKKKEIVNGNSVIRDCVYFTKDGGMTWKIKLDTLMYSGGLTVIDVFDENTIMATGPYNQVWMTVDGGLNWYLQNGLFDLHRFYGIADLSLNTKTTAIAMSVGHSEIYKYSENPIHVENIELTLDNEIIILPNPATEYIEISFEENGRKQTADYSRELDIQIFNVYGIQMTVMVQNFEPLRIDVSSFPDGLYFLKLSESLEFSESYRIYKFVVLK